MKELSERICAIPLSAALKVDLKAKELRAQGKNIINFCVGEPPEAVPDFVCAASEKAAREGQMKYTNASGITELKQAVAGMYKRRFGIDYGVSQIVITTGAKYAVYAAVCALVDPGDEVILPAPYWTSYYQIIRLAGAVPIVADTKKENGYKMTPVGFRAAAGPRTKAVILNNPNNPSGAFYSAAELEALAVEFRKADVYVIADEIYDRLVYSALPFTAAAALGEDMKSRTVSVNGVSKAWAMTGARIGWLCADERIAAAASALISHSTGSPNTIAQLAAIEAINNGDEYALRLCESYKKRAEIISDGLSGIPGLYFAKPEGAFYITLCLEGSLLEKYKDGEGFALALLEEEGVAAVPCREFGNKNAVRISFSVPEAELAEGIGRIAHFAGKEVC